MKLHTKVLLLPVLMVSFLLLASSYASGFPNSQGVGKITINSKNAHIIRDGQKKSIGSFGLIVHNGDEIITDSTGKATIVLDGGNNIYLGPASKMTLTKQMTQSGGSKVTNFFMSILGKMRAKINKSSHTKVKVKTVTAVIGVKGTDFIVEYVDRKTTVGTLEGLVNMMSSVSKQSVDIPPGKMCSIPVTGEVLPLSEFAGELMNDMEFAGEKMDESDYSGDKVTM